MKTENNSHILIKLEYCISLKVKKEALMGIIKYLVK